MNWTSLIEGGFLAQTMLVLVVWGTVSFLAITKAEIPDALLDAGFVIIGFYFRSAVAQVKNARLNGSNYVGPR